ncbi:MAG: YggS family pyridoxal phosphate-dependent enzyme [Actinomycetes bacterium]
MADQQRLSDIAVGLAEVRGRIDAARAAAGRADRVDLVVVTKTFPATDVAILADLGITDIAENRDQEARAKRAEVEALQTGGKLRWHMIGQLQRKKAGSVAQWADVVESVDRLELVDALSRAALTHDRQLDVLVQVALDPVFRPDRGGADPSTALDLASAVASEQGLNLCGVMGVAPWPGDPSEAFERLRALAEQARIRWPAATTISAGMSGDLEEAVACGATQVRVGGAILGPRGPVQ